MHPLASATLISWRRNGAYALRLVGDLNDAQFVSQPPGLPALMNHPAWILSHLNVYAPICSAMLRRQPFADPIDHPDGQKSQVRPRAADYPSRASLLSDYQRTHDDAQSALERADDRVFAEPNPLERWRALHPTIGDMITTLMVKHESHHLGQLSAWRRAMGLPPVAM
jgi:hypothetical protein